MPPSRCGKAASLIFRTGYGQYGNTHTQTHTHILYTYTNTYTYTHMYTHPFPRPIAVHRSDNHRNWHCSHTRVHPLSDARKGCIHHRTHAKGASIIGGTQECIHHRRHSRMHPISEARNNQRHGMCIRFCQFVSPIMSFGYTIACLRVCIHHIHASINGCTRNTSDNVQRIHYCVPPIAHHLPFACLQ